MTLRTDVIEIPKPRFRVGAKCIYRARGEQQARLVVITAYPGTSVREALFVLTEPVIDKDAVCEADLTEIKSDEPRLIAATFIESLISDDAIVNNPIGANTRFFLKGPPHVEVERIGASRGWRVLIDGGPIAKVSEPDFTLATDLLLCSLKGKQGE